MGALWRAESLTTIEREDINLTTNFRFRYAVTKQYELKESVKNHGITGDEAM